MFTKCLIPLNSKELWSVIRVFFWIKVPFNASNNTSPTSSPVIFNPEAVFDSRMWLIVEKAFI